MYKANGVPVGQDQSPHVELTREIARRFNHLYSDIFPLPEVLLTPEAKILGIDRRKMSKGYDNAIYISDTEDTVNKKVGEMITDPQRARKSDPGRPSFCNVFTFHKLYSKKNTIKEIEKACLSASIGCVDCKRMMADSLNKELEPLRNKRQELKSKPGFINDVINEGNQRASGIAKNTLQEVREVVKI